MLQVQGVPNRGAPISYNGGYLTETKRKQAPNQARRPFFIIMAPPRLPRGLYGITPEWSDTGRLLAAIRAAARGGLRVLQWRRKDGQEEALREQARIVAQLCRALGVVCIVNDRWQWLADGHIDAHGVHLGRDDGDLTHIRRTLGPDVLIGVSCYDDIARAQAALAAGANYGADYVAFGAVYPSPTKPQAVRAPLELLTQARALTDAYSRMHPTVRPAVVAIGGITPANAAPVVNAGADAIALISSLFADSYNHDDIAHAAQRCAALYDDNPPDLQPQS